MNRATLRLVSLFLVSVALAACAGAASPSPQPSASPSASGTSFALNPAPPDLGCDAMRPPYEGVTFKIDPDADEPVTATANTGAVLKTYWSTGFVGGTAIDPVVRDAGGTVVVANGDTLAMPEADWPRLHGYFVCPSTDSLYILEADPS